MTDRKRIYLNALPEYEMKLLTALSFFLGRPVSSQAAAALAMYIRQSHDRIMAQVEFYANKAGMTKYEYLNLIYEDADKAEALMKGEPLETIHEGEVDVFTTEE